MMKTKLFAVVGATLSFMVLPFASIAAETVNIESQLNVANVTAGHTAYTPSTSAKVDEVVKVQVYLHNKENPDSGKVANNVKAKIVLPTQAGKAQTLTSTVNGDNTNVVSDSALVNLSLDSARLEYVAGSAEYKYNAGTNDAPNYKTDKIADTIVTTGVNLGDLKPCYNFESYVTILVRVKAPVVGLTKTVKVDAEGTKYAASNTAKPGDTLSYAIVVKNYGNTSLKNVVVGDNLPPHLQYVKGTTKMVNSNTGIAGKMLVDGITTGGVYVDDLAPGASETVFLKAKVNPSIPCGPHTLKNVGVVKADGLQEVYNVATTTVNVECKTPVTPVTTKPTPTPTPTPEVTPEPVALPATGPEAGLAAMAGLGSVAYAGRAYLRSKQSLVDALRK